MTKLSSFDDEAFGYLSEYAFSQKPNFTSIKAFGDLPEYAFSGQNRPKYGVSWNASIAVLKRVMRAERRQNRDET